MAPRSGTVQVADPASLNGVAVSNDDTAPMGAPPGQAEEPAASTSRHPLPRIMAVANQKGGVGKTTTTVNLGASLAELGLRTLLIDLDPQGNASTGLGIENRGLEHSMYHVMLHDEPLENVVVVPIGLTPIRTDAVFIEPS